MSTRWSCTFSAAGDPNEIDRLKKRLEAMNDSEIDNDFWYRTDMRVGGDVFLCVDAYRKWCGIESTEAMVSSFPTLTFIGVIAEQSHPETDFVFDGRGGEMTCREISREFDFDRPLAKRREDVERWIGESRKQLARDQERLAALQKSIVSLEDHLVHLNRRIEGEAGKATSSPVV